MKLCLLVINYNGLPYLSVHLKDMALFCRNNEITLIVTDDLSTDGSVAYLQEHGVTYTVNTGHKHGFAANVNHGIKYAAASGDFDHYIVSNNDIALGMGMFEAMKLAVQTINYSDASYGLIGFDEILADRKEYFQEYNYQSYNVNTIKQVIGIPGFFFIIRNKLLQQIGYLDEDYFMYGEDNDYFLRARNAGFTIYNTCLPVLHFSEGSSVNAKRTSWYVYRNAFLYARKNLGFSGQVKLFLSFINQIYNPFYKKKDANNYRITRNGFFYNNYLLIRSILWNMRESVKQKTPKT